MSEIELAESRVVIESPVHGAEVVAELARLRHELKDTQERWTKDEREARQLLRFALYEIETEARAAGADKIHARTFEAIVAARLVDGKSTEAVKNLLDAVRAALIPSKFVEDRLRVLEAAYEPFRGAP